uniref:Type II inositol 3,4-bisphosphate 4-phosphatase-like n=1 Tax=Pundamilia nyererei TaxID=303518 RepID=A0A3B4FKH4_9CICH
NCLALFLSQRSFLGFASFSIRDLLRVKEPHVSLMLCAQVSKVYRFKTEDQRWLLVREQMSETPLSFSLPKQLLSLLTQEHTNRYEVKELGDLSPHWDGLRHDVVSHCNHVTGCYQELLAELEKVSASSCFKSSTSKSDRHLQFVPTNLHTQRMEVTSPDSVWYDVITFGAPADHHQAFKHGGLKKLLRKHTNLRESVTLKHNIVGCCRLISIISTLSGLALLRWSSGSQRSCSPRLDTKKSDVSSYFVVHQTEQFVHALKEELVKCALLEIHNQCIANANSSHVHSNGLLCENCPADQEQDGGRHDTEYDDEEWDRVWVNVGKSINCIVAMVDRLQQQEEQTVMSPEPQEGDTNSQNTGDGKSRLRVLIQTSHLLPLVVTLRDCVREAVGKAQVAMTFVVLQEAVDVTVAQGPAHIAQRRHAVFSQALSAVVCGVMLKLYRGLEDPDFLRQLHTVGVLAQFESLLSTHGDEIGMLEDMEVGVADLKRVVFTITEAKTEQPDDLLPTLNGTWGSFIVEVPLPPETFSSLPQELKDGLLIRVDPVLFNIGINQHQSYAERFGDCSLQERINQQSCEQGCLIANSETMTELNFLLLLSAGIQSLADLLSSLERSIEAKKRKNVEVLWIAAKVCRKVNGVRLTSCKSAKDRTAMSVTLEQCALLRERHTLSQQHFSTALDWMRRCTPSELPQCLAPKAPRRHLYPVAFLLVTSHLLVLWLILSLVILLAKYQ